MSELRIEITTSRTAEWTCVSRAASYLERDSHYESGDYVALELVPGLLKPFLYIGLVRRLFARFGAPRGIYEYVIARTKLIDAAFQEALAEGFDQVLIMGAGFDSRALRFGADAPGTHIFELDVPITQQAKIGQYAKRGLSIPPNFTCIPIDFDKESLPEKLMASGFRRGLRSLFIMEGLVMYLQPESVDATFGVIQEFAGPGSRVVFDTVHGSVLRRENRYYGERDIVKSVTGADEQWHFAIDEGEVEEFLAVHGLRLVDLKDAAALEHAYFREPDGQIVGRVNGTHCLVTAEY